MPGTNPKQEKKPTLQNKKRKSKPYIIMLDEMFKNNPTNFGKDEIVIINPEKKAKGGRVGLKSGSKGCKLAMKGKGKAYGKNS